MALQDQILFSDQAIGREFRHPGGIGFILLSQFQAGTPWTLQAKSPDGEWVQVDGDAGLEFQESGYKAWYADPVTIFRLNGGVMGAKAWLTDNTVSGGGGGRV